MRVVFAVVPFADIARPSIGVSLLKAEVSTVCSASVQYLNLDFAATIGQELYGHLCHEVASDTMAGEWFFADLIFPNQLPPPHEFASRVLAPVTPTDIVSGIDRARAARLEFIDASARRIAALRPTIVGFTTTFHQTCACLAIARRLKELPDPPLIVFGGANCEGVMGQQMLESFGWIDYVCTREGDAVFPAFVERLQKTGDDSPLPGLLKQGHARELSFPAVVDNLDELPIPDYEDYFDQLSRSPLAHEIKPSLLIETARGCWWGAKHHCTFCGLNGDTMGFRAKSPRRVVDELLYLRERYGVRRIDSVDNILDLRYVNQVFPELKQRNADIEMFYEVKSNLKRQQLSMLHDGGVRVIQPGIESFSDEVLSLMRKGVSGFQNIQLLKWSEEVGIQPAWNILAGFPGEDPAEYQWTASIIPLLTHLEPPTGCAPIRLDRFSPLFTRAEEMGLRRVRPTHAYYYVFPLGRRELSRLAYFFDFDYGDGRTPEKYMEATQQEAEAWRNARFGDRRPRLDATIRDDATVAIADTRPCARSERHVLSDCDADVYLACDAAQTPRAVAGRLSARYSASEVNQSLARLVESALVLTRGDHFLGLGVLRNRPAASSAPDDVLPAYASAAANPEPLLHLLRRA
jgi:ribosomal peptide maturation radical SAM protein 1